MNKDMAMITVALIGLLLVLGKTQAKFSEEDCEVCMKFLQKFVDESDADTKSSEEKIENALEKTCAKAKGKDNRFCYYVGALEISSVKIIKEISRPLSNHYPVVKVCQSLSKKDPTICELKYEKKLDLTKANFKKMRVKELKKILSSWDEQCKGCTEKSEIIQRIEELLPIHDPEAAKARSAAKQEL